jgi:hypothetical protein
LKTPYLRKTKKYDLFGDDPACNNKTGETCPDDWRVNFAHFPCEFQTIDEALTKYNELGLPIKI